MGSLFRFCVPAVLLFGTLAFVVASPAGARDTYIVNVVGFNFQPPDRLIQVGDTVRWVWMSGDHTVTEGVGPFPSGGEAFNELISASTGPVEITFDSQFLFDNPRVANSYDYYCVPHFAFGMLGNITVKSPWSSVSPGLAGVSGVPQLLGTGTLEGGTTATIELSNAAPSATVGLFISFAFTPVPFKGGLLCTIPIAVSSIFPIGPSGSVVLPSVIPAGIPAGAEVFWQYGIQDAAAIAGVSLTNCLKSTFP